MTGDGDRDPHCAGVGDRQGREEQTGCQAAKDKRATERAEKRMTQTAEAQDAIDSLTALAQPTPTATATRPNRIPAIWPARSRTASSRSRFAEAPSRHTRSPNRNRHSGRRSAAGAQEGRRVTLKVDAVTVEVVADHRDRAERRYTTRQIALRPPALAPDSARHGRQGPGWLGMGDPFIVKRVDRG